MSSAAPPRRVLCLGGGWTALWLARRLRGPIKRGDVELTIVSRDNYHTFHGFIGEMLGGRIQPQQLISPSRRIFAPARFRNAEIEGVDLERQTVTVSRLLDGRPYELTYDDLVIALGSADNLERYPGLEEHALRLKTFWECFKARSRLVNALEMAEIEPDEAERRKLLTVVVVGGGFGGIEVAAEILDHFKGLARKEYPHIDPEEIRVVVIHGGERILPEMERSQPKLVGYAEDFLDRIGLEIHTSTRIASATPEEAILDTGERIPTRTIISCAGTAMPPIVESLPLPRHESGRLAVLATGQVEGHDHIWAAGDCAAMPHPHGGVCPQVAIYAMMGGRHIGTNLRRLLVGKPLKPYAFTGLGEAASLSHRRAIYHLKGLRVTGLPAWVLWRLTFLAFMPHMETRLRVVADWMVTALVGRNATNVHLHEPYGVRRERYEAGQAIVRQGEVGRKLFVIWEGEVDIVRQHDDGTEEHVVTLTRGEHFGETAVFENTRRTATARARTPVEVLCLGRTSALALSQAVGSFGATVRRLPGEEREAPRDPIRPETPYSETAPPPAP